MALRLRSRCSMKTRLWLESLESKLLLAGDIVAGDSNQDGIFDQHDITHVLQANKYRTGESAEFSEGDWNSDGVFDQFDVIHVLLAQTYLQPPASVPPPQVWTTDAQGNDQYDFAPEETVFIQGSGFDVGQSYDIVVTRPDGSVIKGDGNFNEDESYDCPNGASECWDTVTDGGDLDTDNVADGQFVYNYILDGIEGDYIVDVYESPWKGDGSSDRAVVTTVFSDSAGSYTINYTAANPSVYIPPIPFPGGPTCPTGTGTNPIPNAHFDDSVNSLAPSGMALGQIVPFFFEVTVDGSTSPENGEITIVGGWDIQTTGGGGTFGYNESLGVTCAFIDTGDPDHTDPGGNATVSTFSWALVDSSAPAGLDEIQGTFDLSGLDDGDVVVVEAWLVVDDPFTSGTGNVPSRLVSAETSDGDSINTGNQAVPLNQVGTFTTVEADLSITKSDSPDPVLAGGELTYTITVTNNTADVIANTVQVEDTLDSNTSFVSATPSVGSCSEAGGVVTCDLGAIAGNGEETITIVVDVSESAPTSGTLSSGDCTGAEDLCNNVSVSALTDDPNSSNDSDSEPTDVIAQTADLSISKVDDVDPILAGQTLTYTVTVNNAGPQTAEDVVVTDTLPAGVTFVSTSGCAEDPNGVATCSLGDITSGGSAQYTITVTVDAGTSGTITNDASVTSNTDDPDSSNNSTSEDTTVNQPPCSGHPFTLTLDDTGTAGIDVIVVDNSTAGTATAVGPSTHADADATEGLIFYTGPVGSFALNYTSATSKPRISAADEALIDISSVNQGPGTLVIEATDTCFELSTSGAHQLISPIGGITDGAVTFVETVDLDNDPFGSGPSNTVGPLGPNQFSGQGSSSFTLPPNNPISLTKTVTISHPGSASSLTTLGAGGVVIYVGDLETDQTDLAADTVRSWDFASLNEIHQRVVHQYLGDTMPGGSRFGDAFVSADDERDSEERNVEEANVDAALSELDFQWSLI